MRRIIAELGLRYRPSAQADLEAHAGLLALLAADVADMPPHILKKVAQQWARESHFMPKSSELIARCRAEVTGERVSSAPPPKSAAELRIDEQARDRWQKANTRAEIEEVWAWERRERITHGLHVMPIAPPLTRDELDRLPAHIVDLGLKTGLLQRRDGKLLEKTNHT